VSDYEDLDLDLDLTPPSVGAQYHPAETEDVLLQIRAVIENARPVPLSSSSMITKDEVLELVEEALEQLPEELRAARWLLKEREEFLARTRHEADEILTQATARAERMVQRTEVVKAAEQRAYEIVEAAQGDARRLRHEVEDFCDQKLASFEIVLERTQRLVGAGRAKLQGTNLLAEAAAAAAVNDEHDYDYDDEGFAVDAYGDIPGVAAPPPIYDEHANLDDALPLYDSTGTNHPAAATPSWDETIGNYDMSHPDESERSPRQTRLTVVDDRYSDLPPPPAPTAPETIRDAAASFFDQDLD
jgi:vacuolar-type H+-ATPase subunit H